MMNAPNNLHDATLKLIDLAVRAGALRAAAADHAGAKSGLLKCADSYSRQAALIAGELPRLLAESGR